MTATLLFPNIDPVIFGLGPFQVRWYGFMYVLGFIASFLLIRKQIREQQLEAFEEHFENLNLLLIISVVIGGRLGYVFFYNFSYYMAHPLEIPATWSGGMSFHGACLALFIAGFLFCKIKTLDFWAIADIYVATFPIGLFFGRIGNFINGELYGRIVSSDYPWAMIFPGAGSEPRHPSQLYEAMLEGILLFLILWGSRNKPWQQKKYWPHGTILALFLAGYGVFRIFVENFREPDAHLGFIFAHITMGQLLSSAMVGAGLTIWLYRISKKEK